MTHFTEISNKRFLFDLDRFFEDECRKIITNIIKDKVRASIIICFSVNVTIMAVKNTFESNQEIMFSVEAVVAGWFWTANCVRVFKIAGQNTSTTWLQEATHVIHKFIIIGDMLNHRN